MKIIIENIPAGSEPEIIIKCNEPDESLLQLIYSLKSSSKKLIGFTDLQMHIINPKDVFYFESVDNKVFIYCKQKFSNQDLSSTKLSLNMRTVIFLEHQSQQLLIFLK